MKLFSGQEIFMKEFINLTACRWLVESSISIHWLDIFAHCLFVTCISEHLNEYIDSVYVIDGIHDMIGRVYWI